MHTGAYVWPTRIFAACMCACSVCDRMHGERSNEWKKPANRSIERHNFHHNINLPYIKCLALFVVYGTHDFLLFPLCSAGPGALYSVAVLVVVAIPLFRHFLRCCRPFLIWPQPSRTVLCWSHMHVRRIIQPAVCISDTDPRISSLHMRFIGAFVLLQPHTDRSRLSAGLHVPLAVCGPNAPARVCVCARVAVRFC